MLQWFIARKKWTIERSKISDIISLISATYSEYAVKEGDVKIYVYI